MSKKNKLKKINLYIIIGVSVLIVGILIWGFTTNWKFFGTKDNEEKKEEPVKDDISDDEKSWREIKKKYDKNNDGKITWSDIENVDKYKNHRDIFNMLELNKTGITTFSQFQTFDSLVHSEFTKEKEALKQNLEATEMNVNLLSKNIEQLVQTIKAKKRQVKSKSGYRYIEFYSTDEEIDVSTSKNLTDRLAKLSERIDKLALKIQPYQIEFFSPQVSSSSSSSSSSYESIEPTEFESINDEYVDINKEFDIIYTEVQKLIKVKISDNQIKAEQSKIKGNLDKIKNNMTTIKKSINQLKNHQVCNLKVGSYQISSPTDSKPRGCQSTPPQCGNGEYIVKQATSTSNVECKKQGDCGNRNIKQAATETSNVECCSTLSNGRTYITGTDKGCNDWKCGDGFYRDGDECQKITTCKQGEEYEKTAPTLTSNRICTSYREVDTQPCAGNKWLDLFSGSKTSDRQCKNYTTDLNCRPTEKISTKSPTSDYKCVAANCAADGSEYLSQTTKKCFTKTVCDPKVSKVKIPGTATSNTECCPEIPNNSKFKPVNKIM